MAGFIQLLRAEPADELLRYPNAFALLTLIALRARREVPQINPHGLQIGEAMIGDHAAVGLSRQEFRSAVSNLQKWSLITIRATNKGTIAKLSGPSVYDINAGATNQQSNQPATSQQPASNQPATTNKNVIKKKGEEDYEKAAAEKLETEKLVLQAEVLNLKAQLAGQAAPATFNPSLHTDPADEQLWSEGPLTKPKPFRVICERLGFLEIDFEHYRKQALVAAEDGDISRTISQWSGWIRNYLNNQMKNGPLLKMQAGGGTLPTHATPDSQYPPMGQEQAGQVFYITGVHDQSHDRMYATSRLNKWPTATIVSLTHPAGAYTMQDGQVIRK